MSIAENIKRIRLEHGLSQTELGKIAGVSDKAVSTWELGLKTPRMGAVEKMANYFGIAKSVIVDDAPSTVQKLAIPPSFESMPKMKQSDFASRLALALEQRNMKAVDLSRKTDVSEGTISCYINGKYQAKQNRVKVFAEALNVNPAWLMGYDVPMDEPIEPNQPAPPSTTEISLNGASLTPTQIKLLEAFDQLNEEGQTKAVEYVEDLVLAGRYKKGAAMGVDRNEA